MADRTSEAAFSLVVGTNKSSLFSLRVSATMLCAQEDPGP